MKRTCIQKSAYLFVNDNMRILSGLLKTNCFQIQKVILIFFLSTFYLASFSQKREIFIDTRDGQQYKTIKIGKYIWMTENLKYNSDSSYFLLNDPSNMKYGKLYTVKNSQTACPSGWHLPTSIEWGDLYKTIGPVNSYNSVHTDYSGKIFDENGFNVVSIPNEKGKLNRDGICFLGATESWYLIQNPNRIWVFMPTKPYLKLIKKDPKNVNIVGFIRCVKD